MIVILNILFFYSRKEIVKTKVRKLMPPSFYGNIAYGQKESVKEAEDASPHPGVHPDGR